MCTCVMHSCRVLQYALLEKKHVICSYVTFLEDQFNQNNTITIAVNISLILSNITGIGGGFL